MRLSLSFVSLEELTKIEKQIHLITEFMINHYLKELPADELILVSFLDKKFDLKQKHISPKDELQEITFKKGKSIAEMKSHDRTYLPKIEGVSDFSMAEYIKIRVIQNLYIFLYIKDFSLSEASRSPSQSYFIIKKIKK